MTLAEYHMALAWGMAVCAFMIVVTIARSRNRGIAAYIQASSYAVMGFLLLALRRDAGQAWTIGLGIALFALFVADFVARSGYPVKKSDKP